MSGAGGRSIESSLWSVAFGDGSFSSVERIYWARRDSTGGGGTAIGWASSTVESVGCVSSGWTVESSTCPSSSSTSLQSELSSGRSTVR